MFLDKQLGNGCTWINLDIEKIKILKIYLKSTDWIRKPSNMRWIKNERAHMDYNRENGTVTFIYNVLDLEKDKEYYEAIPMTFIVEKQRIITISNHKNALRD